MLQAKNAIRGMVKVAGQCVHLSELNEVDLEMVSRRPEEGRVCVCVCVCVV